MKPVRKTANTLQPGQRINYNKSQIQGFNPETDRYLPMTSTIASVFTCGVEVQVQLTNSHVIFYKFNDLVTLAKQDKLQPMQANVNANPTRVRSATGLLITID